MENEIEKIILDLIYTADAKPRLTFTDGSPFRKKMALINDAVRDILILIEKNLKMENLIEENNTMIAEFMQLEVTEVTPTYTPKRYYVKEYNSGEWYLPKDMKYHECWSWLMTVVERIEILGYSYDRINADVFINKKGENVIPNPMDGNTIEKVQVHHPIKSISAADSTMREKTYQLVVEFIKFYNESKTK